MGLGGSSSKIMLSMAIACTQAALLAYFFMHLKESDQVTWLVVGSSIFWLIILFLFILTDYLTRHHAVL
jgi:cytochrome c oxidase subunit 4